MRFDVSIHKRTSARLGFWASTLCLLPMSLLLLGVVGCESGELDQTTVADTSDERALVVNTIAAEWYTAQRQLHSFVGKLQASRKSELGFELPGRIQLVMVQEGDVVSIGTVLAQLNDERLVLKCNALEQAYQQSAERLEFLNPDSAPLTPDQIRARIVELRAELNQLDADLVSQNAINEGRTIGSVERLRILERQVALTNEISRQTQIEELTRQTDELYRQHQEALHELSSTELVAPYNGVISRRYQDEGTIVSAGAPVVQLMQTNLEVWVSVPVLIAAEVHIGQQVSISIDGVSFLAEIETKLPDVDPTIRTRTLILRVIENHAVENLVPGQSVDVEFWTDTPQSGFWIPMSALVREVEGLWSVFVCRAENEQNYVERRYVDVLRIETQRVLVQGTIQIDDLIIADGVHRIVPGQQVVPLDNNNSTIDVDGDGATGQ